MCLLTFCDKVSAILKKAEASRTEEEWRLLQQSDDVVEMVLKRTQVKEQTRQRHLEVILYFTC